MKQDELILSPIEAAIENVNDRVKAIRAELTAAAPRVNTLQQVTVKFLPVFHIYLLQFDSFCFQEI